MNNRQKLIVTLPSQTTTVTLPEHVGRTLEHLFSSGKKGISELELIEAGCLNPAKVISAIAKRGAIIGKEQKDAMDAQGEIHARIAHYTYHGWHIDAVNLQIEHETAKACL
jgi:hypothetical protein